jgi:hypothetical protein
MAFDILNEPVLKGDSDRWRLVAEVLTHGNSLCDASGK